MTKVEERASIYMALMILSTVCGLFLGFGAGAWSFLQMVGVVELTYLIGDTVINITLHSH